jgi:hypothetical protein
VFSTFSAVMIAVMVPLVILIISLVLSLKCFVCRRTIGKAVAIIGILEMMSFFMFSISLDYIVYQVPYEARLIISLQGLLTILGGLVTLVSAKPKETKENLLELCSWKNRSRIHRRRKSKACNQA